jgi:hypothetical protein
MNKGLLIVAAILSLMLAGVGLYAGGYFDNAGNTISGLVTADPASGAATQFCSDSDSGIDARTAGYVEYTKGTSIVTALDECKGAKMTLFGADGKSFTAYKNISEKSCGTDNKLVSTIMSAAELGAGYCRLVEIDVAGKTGKVAVWISEEPLCIKTTAGANLGNGSIYKDGCGVKPNDKIFTTYTCDELNKTLIATPEDCTTADGFGKCLPTGCTGNCKDTDPADNINVPGVVTAGDKTYKDACRANGKDVMQYKCSNGKPASVVAGHDNDNDPIYWKSCGNDRLCVVDAVSGAGYCKDKYATNATISDLTTRVEDLERRVTALEAGTGSGTILP